MKGKSICIKFACLSYHSFRSFYMVDGGKSCFRSSERKVVSTPPFRADFTQQSSPRSSHGLLRKTNLCRAFLQQEVSHLFMFTHKTYCLFNSWLYGIGIRFIPNNLKRKARCGSNLLEYVQVNKIMQKLRKRKVRKHLKVLPRKVFQNRQACHQLQSGPVRFLHRSNHFFTSLKHRFTQRSGAYNFCPNENKSFHRISSVSKHLQKNRGSGIEKWKVRTNPSKTTVTSQIGSPKIVFTSLMRRMTLFKFNLCRDIEKNPGPGARRHLMN